MTAALAARDWRTLAACRGADADLFFPVGTQGPALTQIAEAKQVCMGCPVRHPCLDFAVTTRQAGVWGGATEEERHAERRRRQRRAVA